MNYGIHWFRRDLRIAGNENLRHNWKLHQGRVLGLFCIDAKFLAREDFSHNRFAFFLQTLQQLKAELRTQGGDLLVIDGSPQTVFPTLLSKLKHKPQLVSWGCDYEPFARARDAEVQNLIESAQVKTHAGRDHLLLEPHEILKDNGMFYQVYSPYARRWFADLNSAEVKGRIEKQKQIERYYEKLKSGHLEKIFSLCWKDLGELPYADRLDFIESENKKSVTIPIPAAGFSAAYERLALFKENLNEYNENRNYPFLDGTSQLSMFLKNGSLTSAQIIYLLGLGQHTWRDQGSEQKPGAQFLKEIAWREFYYSILFHRPDVEKNSFLPQYRNLKWENNKDLFRRWCEGQTGFPIVDAGMRQLNQTGWMHNRVRMIVASFLTKDLLIDWRWGEQYFMKMLLDGDLAANNGGWQWAASTGCDPQPYFRIFNPWLQAEKFDPDATYIKTFVPELREFSPKVIHAPDSERGSSYPAPMVNHSQQKLKALHLFKSAQI